MAVTQKCHKSHDLKLLGGTLLILAATLDKSGTVQMLLTTSQVCKYNTDSIRDFYDLRPTVSPAIFTTLCVLE